MHLRQFGEARAGDGSGKFGDNTGGAHGRKKGIMLRRAFPLMILALSVFGGEAWAQRSSVTQEEIRDLQQRRARLESTLKTLSNKSQGITAKQNEIDATKASLGRLQRENESASKNLESLQDLERKRPGSINEQALRSAELDNRRTYAALTSARKNIGTLESELIDLRSSVVQENADFEMASRNYEGRLDVLADRMVDEQVRGLQVQKTTQATGRAACDNLTLTQCRQLSQKNAELKASEQGSVVVVDSMTEVKNFKLSKEELRSVVSATLSDVRVLEQKLVDEQYYQTRISATVVPAISPTLRQQLRQTARTELITKAGGPLDYSTAGAALITPPPTEVQREDPGRELARQEEQRRRLEEERRRLEYERQELANRQRREEAERIARERAERDAADRRKRTFTPTF